MPYDPLKHHRHSIRLKGYDYSKPDAYFITFVTQDRECLFGEVADDELRLNPAGDMVEKWWLELNHKFPAIETDEYVIMPNHFHGIVIIGVGADLCVGPDLLSSCRTLVRASPRRGASRGSGVNLAPPIHPH